ncbi:DUF2092 domain-containing protein [Reyranella sp.]|uniref:DUF2092 domain-containing protein n=1 Tax=Reyranella sp. TaxID=1929291 RepID=UPI003BA97986
MRHWISAFLAMAMGATAVQAQQTPTPPAASAAPDLAPRVEIEPAALAIVKAMSDRLAGAKTMSFTALATYESPDRTGLPLAYTTLSEVTLQRPDRLKVITLGDGPRTEFYYDGKTVQAFEPAANLVAKADAPPTIDAMLHAAFQHAAIYFPFTDLVVADPLKAIAENLRIAFVVGQSQVVGGVPTDIVVLVGKFAHVQLWIGRDDKLPRMAQAIFLEDPAHYRHTVRLSDWKIDPVLPADAFAWKAPAGAVRIPFAPPGARVPAPAKK